MGFDPHSSKARFSLSTIDSEDIRSNYNDRAPLRQQPERVDSMASSENIEPKRQETFNNVDMDENSAPAAVSHSTYTQSTYPERPQRPQALTRMPSIQTRYMEMLLHLDDIPRLHNILASAFTWVLLAGFLVVPGTFTSFKNSQAFKNADEGDSSDIASAIVHSVAHIGLLWVSGALALIGAGGCFYLWFKWRLNYVWLINRIFLPATLNSVAGLLTTVVSVYTAQKGVWSVTAKITAIVTSSCIGISGGLFCLYNFWLLKNVRGTHEREVFPDGRPKKRESMVEKVKRKAKEPALEPGSVV